MISLTRPLHNVVWNLFLAIIPVALAFIIFVGIRNDTKTGRVRWIAWVPLLAAWLAFLPNTCYLVTEWRHYTDQIMRNPELYWDSRHDPLLFASLAASFIFYSLYSISGLIFFYLSIYPLDVLFEPPWTARPLFFFVCSLGVYLGLVDRFNSWQIVSHPHTIFHAAHAALERPFLFLILFAFSLVLWLFYEIFGLTMDGARARYRKYRPAKK